MSSSVQISPKLQALLDQFAASGSDAKATAQSLTEALQNDSALTDQYNAEVALGVLKGFSVGAPPGQAANANGNTGLITFNSTEINSESLSDLIFQAGHEGQHLVNDVSVADNQFSNDVSNLASKGPGQDYTQLVASNQLAHNQDEASANISGWNDYVSNFQQQWQSSHPAGVNPTAKDLYFGNEAYAGYFIDSTHAYSPRVTLNSDFTVSATAANIAAEGNAYYLGANLGGVSYPSFNGAWQLSVIAAAVGPNGWGALDFQAIPGLDLGQVATQLNRTAGGTPLGSGSFTVHDTSSNATNTFSTSSGGTTVTSQTATALGDGYNTDGTYYAPSGDDGYGGFGYEGAGYSGGDDDDDDWDDMDPVILNLQGGKVQTQSLATSSASFRMQTDGQPVKTGWATAGEGILVYDAAHSGIVRNEASLVSGFDALKTLDSNGDGKLDASDAAWNDLKVWVDRDGTAQFNAASLYSMAQLGIASIDLGARHVNQNDHGNTILDDSSFTRSDGTTGDIAGVNLSFNPLSNLDTVQTQASTQLHQLIGAMASFAPPASALTALPAANDRHQSPLLAVAH